MSASLKRTTEVIDLLSDNSDDEKKPPAKPRAKKPKKAQDENTSQRANAAKAPGGHAANQSTSNAVSLKKSAVEKSSMTFNVATYNVWFGPPHPSQRMMALSQCLLARNATDKPLYFVGFQEVTPILWATLKPVLESAGYKVYCQDISEGGYGCALAVLQTHGLKIIQAGWQPYRSTIMNRGFLHARARLPNSEKQVLFTTTHLESFVGNMMGSGQPYTGSPEREKQIQELETFCQNHMKRFPDLSLAMISGDLNWDDERVQSKGADNILTSVLASKEWKDSWFEIREKRRAALMGKNGKVKKKDEPTMYTYDAKESAMLGGSLRRRFDRILLRTQNGIKTDVLDCELIGKEPLYGLTWNKESTWNGRTTTKVRTTME